MHLDRNLRFALGVGLALLPIAIQPVIAQVVPLANSATTSAEPSPGRKTNGALPQFEAFLDQNPNIEARLRENPALINSPAFQKNHPQIAEFLARNPAVKAELASKPRWFVHREMARRSATPVTPAEAAQLDRFLDSNPGLEKQLAQQPQLLRNTDFQSRNPKLNDFMKQHGGNDRAGDFKPGKIQKHVPKPERPEKSKSKP